MNVYLINRSDYDWDEVAGLVIVAKTPHRAREIASAEALAEGSKVWLYSSRTTLKLVARNSMIKTEGVLLKDVHAG